MTDMRHEPAGREIVSTSGEGVWAITVAAALACLLGAAYSNSIPVPLIFDDIEAIRENASIHQLWPITVPLSPPRQTTVAGRPIVNLSLALNYAVSGLNVWTYHVVNIGIHFVCALLLYGILRRTLLSLRFGGRFDRTAAPLAAAAALIWAAHPLHTMCVTYLVQRAESLTSLFYLLTLYCVIRSARAAHPTPWILAAILSCILGMGCKESMATAPLVIWLYDWIFLADSAREVFRRRKWLYAGLAATGFILLGLHGSAPRSESAGLSMQGVPPLAYLQAQPGVLLHYLRLAFWPHPLCLDYHWPIELTRREIVVPAVLVVGLILASVVGLLRRKPIAFAGAWFFLILAPTSSFIPISIVASEHRMYLPLAAVVTLIVAGSWAWTGGQGSTPGRRHLRMAAVGIVVGTLCTLTFLRNKDYRSLVSIWQDVVQKRPLNPRGHNNLGTSLQTVGNLDGAIAEFKEAIRLLPDYGEAHYNLGVALGVSGNLDGAIEHFRRALVGRLRDGRAHYNLGYALQLQGRCPEAIKHYQSAIEQRPDHMKARNGLAICLAMQDRMRDAAEQFRYVLRQEPDTPFALNALAWILATCQDDAVRNGPESVQLAGRAAELTQNSDPAVLDTLAAAYAEVGRFQDAIKTAEDALAAAKIAHQSDLSTAIGQRIALYRSGAPFRETSPPADSPPRPTSTKSAGA